MNPWTKAAKNKRPTKAFFDANVLLEVLDSRKNAKKAVAALRQHADDACISALTGHLVMYFGLKAGATTEELREFLLDYQMQPLGAAEFAWAFEHGRGGDFEDALQIACAISAGAAVFYTLDAALGRRYSDLPHLEIIVL